MSSSRHIYKQLKPNAGLNGVRQTFVLPNVSLPECMNQCDQKYQRCQYFDYDKNTGTCMMLNMHDLNSVPYDVHPHEKSENRVAFEKVSTFQEWLNKHKLAFSGSIREYQKNKNNDVLISRLTSIQKSLDIANDYLLPESTNEFDEYLGLLERIDHYIQ